MIFPHGGRQHARNQTPQRQSGRRAAQRCRRGVTGRETGSATSPQNREEKAAAPARKKVARKKAATGARKTSPGKKTAGAEAASLSASGGGSRKAVTAAGRPSLSRDARQRMIGEAAYLISLKRHAGLTGPEADWLYAETVIDLVFDITD